MKSSAYFLIGVATVLSLSWVISCILIWIICVILRIEFTLLMASGIWAALVALEEVVRRLD